MRFVLEQEDDDGLFQLRDSARTELSPLRIDFLNPSLLHRVKAGTPLGGELLVKALGRDRKSGRVLDATAGLGVDAFILSVAGFEVESIEQHPILAKMLIQARAVALRLLSKVISGDDDDRAMSVGSRMSLSTAERIHAGLLRLHFVSGDSLQVLEKLLSASFAPSASDAAAIDTRLAAQFDFIYLDPMYPESNKDSLPKREMQILRDLHLESSLDRVGTAIDVGDASVTSESSAESLLSAALKVPGISRVILKRPPKSAVLGKAYHHVEGKSARFDIYR